MSKETTLTLDESKILIIDFVLNSLDNGTPDEDVHRELVALEQLAKTIKDPFERHIAVRLVTDTIWERMELMQWR